MKNLLVRACFACVASLSVIVTIACVGPQGPPGPPGPSGSGGGPPYVWVCTPASYPMAGSNTPADLYVFNGSTATANVAVHILDKNGNNLSGANIPGTSPAGTYPGQTGSATVPLSAANTLNVKWQMPVAGGPGNDGVTNVSYTVRVVSDQPIAVSSNFQWSGFKPLPCSLLPK
ncbi:MAG: hypothetical protein ABJB61_08230 [bacterium]